MDMLGSAQDAVQDVAEQAGHLVDEAALKAEVAIEEIETLFMENPLVAFVGALAVGFVLAMVLTRRKRKIVLVREGPRPTR